MLYQNVDKSTLQNAHAEQDIPVNKLYFLWGSSFPSPPSHFANAFLTLEMHVFNKSSFKEYPDYTPDEIKELAKEPNGDINEGTIQETKAALEAEKLGLIEGPILPSVHIGHDFRAGDPAQDWDVKGYDSEHPFDPVTALDKIEQRDLSNDENILFDTSNMTEADIVALENELESRPIFEDRYEFVPPR